jgi:prepilin-type N-terminal cleavage/methylation domain-containing protein
MRACSNVRSNNKGMTLLEVIVSFAIIAIVVVILTAGFTAASHLNARTNLHEHDDAALTLDIESVENLREAAPPAPEHISSNGYKMDISVNTYTSEDRLDSIRTFSYEPKP